MDLSILGREAAELMDALIREEDIADDAEIAHVGLIVLVREPGENQMTVHTQCSNRNKLIQVGLFQLAVRTVEDSGYQYG